MYYDNKELKYNDIEIKIYPKLKKNTLDYVMALKCDLIQSVQSSYVLHWLHYDIPCASFINRDYLNHLGHA